ncbi:Tripartite motif-containing protein 59 [Portunus trituberculatus]|uniref:Tripartite motif-containing protein 59 n=1 Tax=Portunus trituberculatus TaxID=210409 RepID=A0A5B7GCL5_PORTR|nr:Tripartite motif-containing protein 59 [Portunus trituberculatus]
MSVLFCDWFLQSIGLATSTKEQLQCALCCHAYEAQLREAVVLPSCGHTFCRLCLHHLQDQQPDFCCPFCRTQHCGLPVGLLPVNFIVMNLLEAIGKVEGDDYNEEDHAEEVCCLHQEPQLLWCRQCREVLCAKCLSQQQHDGHALHHVRTVLAEKKSHIEDETNKMLHRLQKEKKQLTQEVKAVVSELAKIYERSEKLSLESNKVDSIRKVMEGTNDLMAVAKLELALHRGSNLTSIPNAVLQALLEYRGDNYITGNEERSTDDSARRLSWDEERSSLQFWQLTTDVAGGGRHWPIIPWQRFTAQIPAVQLLVPFPAPEVYLQLEAAGVDLGRIHIRLWGQLRRAQHFLALCLGTFGPSYQGAKFRTVERKGAPGECLRGGDYPARDGKGTSCRGVMAGLEWGGQHAGPVKKGLLGGGGGGCHESDALFNICLQDKPQGKMSCPFGEVVSGLGVVWRAASHHPVSEITITAAGLVHHNT